MDKHRVKLDSDHDFSWERCLTSSAELVQFCRANFLQTIEKIHGDFDKTNEDQQRFQTVVADITESSIRIANSVLAQLATGHPDTAMAICRQLFELSVNIQIIALDSTMKRARRYQDFDNADMLRREIAIAELLNIDGNQDVLEEMQSQLKQYQELYPGDSLDNNHWALVTPQDRESELHRIEGRFKAIATLRARGHRDGTKFFEQQLQYKWLILNKWAHANYTSHYYAQRLGARGRQTRLLGASFTGLDSPLIMAMSSLSEIMDTFLRASGVHDQQELKDASGELNETLKAIHKLIKEVDPNLRSKDYAMTYFAFEEDMLEDPRIDP